MSISTTAAARFRMPAFGSARWLTSACTMTAHTAAVAAYKPSAVDARNGAQGGADAWSPPV